MGTVGNGGNGEKSGHGGDVRSEQSTPPVPTSGGSRAITLTLDETERELIALALGELLSSTTRDEHLIAAVQALLARVHAATTLESEPA
jgi:hypothetical protein